MSFANVFSLKRRDFTLLALGVAGAGLLAVATPADAATNAATKAAARILVLGDSLSAEYGLVRGQGWVNLLQQQLTQTGSAATVVNASISGDTTSGGRTRLPALLGQHHPTHVLIELGGNDALRGLPLTLTYDNLSAMARAAQDSGAQVLLLGMQVPPNYGSAYTRDFRQVFERVAKERKTGLVPFLLQGVADRPDADAWFQADRIHPREKAHPLIMQNVWAQLKPMLK